MLELRNTSTHVGSSISINKIALWIILFFGVFDTARLFTPLPSFLGYLKEVSIFFLFLQLCLKRISFNLRSYWGLTFVLFFSISLLCINRVFFSGYFSNELLIYQIKNIEFFLLFLIFFNLKKLVPSYTVTHLIDIYIKLSLILVIVNLIGTMVPNPICYKYIGRGFDSTMFIGRLSLGQPAMASFPILLSFIWLWTKTNKGKIDFIFLCLLLFYIAASTAMTAYIIILAVIIFNFFIFRKDKKQFKNNIHFFAIVLLIAFCSLNVLISYFSEFSNILDIEFLRARFLKILGYGNFEDKSLGMRSAYRAKILSTLYDKDSFIWGISPDYYEWIKNVNYAKIPIENTYFDILAKFGIIGLLSYLSFLFGYIKYALNTYKIYHNKELVALIVSITLAMVLYSWTLPIFATYCMAFGFALFSAYIFTCKDSIDE